MPLYLLSQFILILIVAGLLMSIFYALRYAFRQRGVEQQQSKPIIWYIMGGLGIWLTFLAVLAYGGFFQNFEVLPPRMLIAVLPPIIITLLLAFSKSFAKTLRVIPPSWLIHIQSFRIAVELFLWLGLMAGFVPFQMTFEGLNFDIIVGVSAIGAGLVFFRKGRHLRFEAFLWNIFGIALLLNIVFISVLSTPSPFRIFMNDPANSMIAFFPFIWIPGFIVPFALAMHLFSIRQLQLNGPQKRTFSLRK